MHYVTRFDVIPILIIILVPLLIVTLLTDKHRKEL